MTTYHINHDLDSLRALLEGLDEMRSRLPFVAEVLQEPNGLNCFILADSNLVRTERADEVEMRVVYKPTALYQKLFATLEAKEVGVVVAEDFNRNIHEVYSRHAQQPPKRDTEDAEGEVRNPDTEARRLPQEPEESRHAINGQRSEEVTSQTVSAHRLDDSSATHTRSNSPVDA
jgi:hypothetical protein